LKPFPTMGPPRAGGYPVAVLKVVKDWLKKVEKR